MFSRVGSVIKNKQGSTLPCFYYKKTDSTNEQAKRLIADGKIIESAVVVAGTQLTGRGRYDRSFLSPKGGAYVSYVHKVVGDDYAALGLYAALAVCNILPCFDFVNFNHAGRGNYVTVKWPNDVNIDGKKVAGILSESIVSGEDRYVIIGIGLNVNTTLKQFGNLSNRATSLFLQNGKKMSCANAAALLSVAMDDVYSAYYSIDGADKEELYNEYLSMSETIGEEISYTDAHGKIQCGKAVNILINGSLIVDNNGTIECISWGEITLNK